MASKTAELRNMDTEELETRLDGERFMSNPRMGGEGA